MASASSSGPQWGGRDTFRFIMWISVAYACIMAVRYLEPAMAGFASLALVMLVWLIDDITSS